MTAVVSIKIAKDLDLDIDNTYFTVSEEAAQMPGTTAYLKYN